MYKLETFQILVHVMIRWFICIMYQVCLNSGAWFIWSLLFLLNKSYLNCLDIKVKHQHIPKCLLLCEYLAQIYIWCNSFSSRWGWWSRWRQQPWRPVGTTKVVHSPDNLQPCTPSLPCLVKISFSVDSWGLNKSFPFC